jgi:hypothetical protein
VTQQIGGAVDFDFAGSLELARRLWSLAADLRTEDIGRGTEADTAKAKWEGAYGEEFAQRRETERTSRTNVAQGLEDDARSWAQAWATAMDQQKKNNRLVEVERIRDDRGMWERGWDSTFGEDDSDDQVPMPDPVSVPQPPSFAATADLTVLHHEN